MFINKFQQLFKTILPILKFYPWGMPVVISLGIINSLIEGISISLLIPLLQALESSASVSINNPFFEYINQLLINFEPEKRTFITAILILLSIVLKVLFSSIFIFVCKWLQHNTVYKIRFQLYKQLLNVNQTFWDNKKIGELSNIINGQTSSSCQALNFLIWLSINVCMILILGSFLLLISWQLTLLVIVAFSLISCLSYLLTKKVKILNKKLIEANINHSNFTLETFLGNKTIKIFRRESYAIKKYKQLSLISKKLSIKISTDLMKVDLIIEALSVSILVIIMLISITNFVNLSIVITFIFMLYRLQPQFKQVNTNLTQLIACTQSIEKVYSLLATTEDNIILFGNQDFNKLTKGIIFDSVTFCYQGKNQPALDNISLFIPQGKTTALVGHSGAGKSTIINLVFRFYDVTSGTIYADNYPLKELNLSSWRSKIAIVSQDIHIFNDTIRNNIAFGFPYASDEDIIKAAKQAHCHEFIAELPQKYDTFIGDRGILLSGGQKQRISIARAILCNPEILILDEATNALDNISEKFIQESIEILSQNRTVIVIAHRLSTIINADKIVVLEKGKIIEEGTFNYLKEQGKIFPKMYQLELRA